MNNLEITSNRYSTVIVCSGGKTGSSTLYKSIQHFFENEPDVKILGSAINEERHTSNIVEKLIREATPENRLLVLTSFREPCSRMISSLFQNIEKHLPKIEKDTFDTQVSRCTNFLNHYLDNKIYFEAYHPMGCPPEFVKDFVLAKAPHIDVLWLRFDQIDKWEEQISTIIPGFKIVPDNISEYKPYAKLYSHIKKNYRNPNFDYLMESEKYMWKYYYTDNQMKTICHHWCHTGL